MRCYGARLADLVYKPSSSKSFSLFIKCAKPDLRLQYHLAGTSLKMTEVSFALNGQKLATGMPYRPIRGHDKSYKKRMLEDLLERIIVNSSRQFANIFGTNAHYLPAARSGVLQARKIVSSQLLRLSPLLGIEPIQIPKLPGGGVDFIASINDLDKTDRGDFYKLAPLLEKALSPGRIELVVDKYGTSDIYYRLPTVGKLSLHRTSSMVSELAPFILFLRHLYRKKDILIIEEPESHLHPANQRILAKYLVRLARGGLKIIVTTHSDYFLQQISNLVALSTKSSNRINRLRYTAEDLISPENVGVYLFKHLKREYATEVSAVEVGENGIAHDEFDQVAEELYDESAEARL